MEWALVGLAAIVAVMALGTLYLCRAHMNKQLQTIAQCDERVKAFMRHVDKALDRLHVLAAPETFKDMRANSGIIEGAQYATKPHYDKDEIPLPPNVEASLNADAQAAARVEAVTPRPVQVRTALDFDRNNGVTR